MNKHYRPAFAVSISFIFLLILSLFLYSCGQNNPTGGTSSGKAQQQIPAKSPIIAPLILLTASSTANDNITIKLTGEPGKIYHLYMTDNINAQASTTAHLPDATTYTLTLDPTKIYYFILGEVGSDGKEHFSGGYITSKPSPNGQNRENIVINPKIKDTGINALKASGKNNSITKNTATGLNPYMKLTGGGRVNAYYYTENYYSGFTSIHVAEPSGGHFIENNWFFADVLGRQGGHPEVIGCVDTNGNPVADCWNFIYRWYDSSSPVAGYWDSDDNRYRNSHADGIFTISFLYDTEPEPYFSFYGQPYLIYRVNVCGERKAEGIIQLEAATDANDWEHITSHAVVTAPSFCPGSTPPDRTLSSILVEPPKATIYIHPKNTASMSQQYKATGTYDDGTTDDITTKAQWHAKTNVATIGMTGLATIPQPISTAKPGSTAIWATVTLPTNPPADLPSNGAELCVECWEVTHIRQNKHVPSDEMPDWVNEPYGRIWTEIYAINPTTGAPISNGRGGYVVNYYIDAGPRTFPGYFNSDIGLYEDSIGHVGCHMVSANMVLTVATHSFSNPKKFNDWLNTQNGFTKPGNGPKWEVINNSYSSYISATNEISLERADEKDKKGNITKKGWTIQDSYNTIDAALDKCNMIILRINGNTGHFQGHYVLIAGGRNGNYTIYDPWVKDYKGDKDTQVDNLWNRYQISGDYEATYNIITLK